ncbi:MAG: ribonuclease Z [Clostridia bacterium]|nr:ribonuclease Z [Clostridia bacterium]
MEIIICLDDNNGMLFNNRRQSRDAKVLEDIKNNLQNSLTIFSFSEKLVSSAEIPYEIMSDTVSENTVLFIEDRGIKEFLPAAHKITVYRWNRVYPADMSLDIDLSAEGFRITRSVDFEGTSHEKITKEVYER